MFNFLLLLFDPFANNHVKVNGITTAIIIPTINIGIDFGMIEINAGNPPIPIAGANTPFNVMNIAATADPIIAA